MGTFFLQRRMCHIANMKLMKCLLIEWIPYLFFAVCLNGNQSRCCLINVLNGTPVKNSHFGLDGVSSTLYFIAEILPSKLGVQPKTNFNVFL